MHAALRVAPPIGARFPLPTAGSGDAGRPRQTTVQALPGAFLLGEGVFRIEARLQLSDQRQFRVPVPLRCGLAAVSQPVTRFAPLMTPLSSYWVRYRLTQCRVKSA